MESKDSQLSGFNLIQQSAIDGNLGTLSNLLKKGVDPDSCLPDGERAKDITALMLAVENNHLDCAQLLIDHGAKLGNTALIALYASTLTLAKYENTLAKYENMGYMVLST